MYSSSESRLKKREKNPYYQRSTYEYIQNRLYSASDEDLLAAFRNHFDNVENVHPATTTVERNSNNSWSNVCSDLSKGVLSQLNYTTLELISGINCQPIRELTKKCDQNGPLDYQLCITYRDFEINLNDSHPLLNETMEIRSDPRVPSKFVMGNRLMIELSTSIESNHEKLNKIVDYLQNRRGTMTQLDTSGIVYSVTGDIPLSYVVNKFNLTRENLNSLIEFTKNQFFELKLARRELLQISTRPIKLNKYFEPLLNEIIEIRKFVRDRNISEYFKNMFNIVVREIMNRVKLVTEEIIQDKNYQGNLKYLQNAYTSFIFNKREMSAYMDELMSLINQDNIKSKIAGSSEVFQSTFQENWNFSIQLRATISVTKAFQSFENNIKLACNRKEFSVDKCQMTECFTEALNEELSVVRRDIENIMSERQSYEEFMKKKIEIKILVESKFKKEEHSNFRLHSYINQVEARTACPILTRPEKVTMLQATDTSINIEWKFEDDSEVTSYKVHYRRQCVSSSDSGTSTTTANQYYSFNTDNKSKTANVTNIAPGEYIFIVQARFTHGTLGIPSHESGPISTLNSNTRDDNDDSINYCTLCEDEKKNFALVPCGHVIGETCALRLEKCPFCSVMIERKLKLYNNC